MGGTHFGALRARGARKARFFSIIDFYLQIRFQRGIARPNRSTHLHFYKVSGTHFRALRAHGAREAKISHDMIIFIARRFQRAIARPNPIK